MNKKLVALAVGGAFALPLAAQAQTANVTLYGRLNLDLEFINGHTCQSSPMGGSGGLGAQANTAILNPATCLQGTSAGVAPPAANQVDSVTVNRVSSNSSRFGMRGTESLGGGLNAVFQIESNVSGDTGNSSGSGLASRETFVGLQGSWGRATMGNFLMPQDDLNPIFGNAPTLTTSILSSADLWAFGGLNKNSGGFDARMGNSIRYDSPNWMGFTGALQYATMDSSGATATTGNSNAGSHPQEMIHANVIGGNVIYSNGPLQAGASFEVNNKVRNQFPTGPNLHDVDWTITGSYNFGTLFQGFGLQIGLVYENTRYNVQTPVASTTAGSSCQAIAGNNGTCTLRRNMWGASATIPIGGGKLYLLYEGAGNGTGSAPDGTAVGYLVHGSNTNANLGEISYSYNLSPRTMLYAGYVKIANGCKAAYTFNINQYAIAVGQQNAPTGGAGDFCSGDPGGFLLGIVHLF
jgi:predicted porin